MIANHRLSMKIDLESFRVAEGETIQLAKRATRIPPLRESKRQYERVLHRQLEEMRSLQQLLYAHDRYSLLLIFQAMDAAGKDSAIRHVMSGVNPQGCQVYSFKQPSAEELDHDFLWRTAMRLPERGRIGIFNRSYYEEVLIVRVHREILERQKLPQESLTNDVWEGRYESIRRFEEHLHRNGTAIMKFFLHVSKDEQRKRFLARIDNPEKNWKFSKGDIQERKHWNAYMQAYQTCIEATSTRNAPWYVVPADHKPDARVIISRAIVDRLKSLDMSYPQLTTTHLAELKAARRALGKE